MIRKGALPTEIVEEMARLQQAIDWNNQPFYEV